MMNSVSSYIRISADILGRSFQNPHHFKRSLQTQTVSGTPLFQLSVFGKPTPIAKNVWNNKLVTKIQDRFPEITLFPEKEEGLIFGNLSVGNNLIMFKGATPLAAMEDLSEGLNMFESVEQQLVSVKIAALAEFIGRHILEDSR